MDLTLVNRNHRNDPAFQKGVNIPNWIWCAVKDEARTRGGSEDIVVRNALKEHFARSKFMPSTRRP